MLGLVNNKSHRLSLILFERPAAQQHPGRNHAIMTKEYTLDEIRRLADTNPEKLAQEYQASRAATANLVDRARAGIAARTANPPTNKFNAWAQGYGNRFIYNGSIKPLAHMMLIVARRLRRGVVVPPQYVADQDTLSLRRRTSTTKWILSVLF
ncbi:hypothetical protein GQ600_3012 [Phytophthora cactorum]|nr:hypothetical protein GQ600_3012 [Phytophthora cactorum]